MGKDGSLYMWSILPSKPVHGLKGDAFDWCTFLTWHGHGKCSWMHLRAAVERVLLSCSEHECAGICSSLVCASLGSRLSSRHWPCHGPCHLSLVTLDWEPSHAGKAQIRFSWLLPNPPDCISLPFTLFSQEAAKPVSKISWTKTIPKEQLMAGACRTKSPWVLARSSSGALQKQKTLKQSKCLAVQQENPFYYNLIKLIVKQRPCSTKPQSPHASCFVLSANGSQVHPKGIPPRREVNPCKGHCVNHHALSLAAAVGNCLWRSRNETLVNPSPNITKIKHHHYPPHKWPRATSTSQLMDKVSPSQERCCTGRWKKQLHFANWRWVYWLAAVSAGALYFPTSLYNRPLHSSFH